MARTLLRYPGGKGRLAKRIIRRFPQHDTYLEPCAGGATVLLAKPRARTEVLTDVDPTIIKMLRALRDTPSLVLGLCSELEYNQEWLDKVQAGLDRHHKLPDARVSAYKIFVHHTTWSGSGKGKLATWSRHAVKWYTPATSWVNKRKTLAQFAARLKGVTIEELDCFDALRKYFSDVTYVDPPYAGSNQHGSVDHVRLASVLRSVPGSRFITHYQTAQYDSLYQGWCREDFRLRNQYPGQDAIGKSKIPVESLYYVI